MKRILILTAALVAIFTVNAFAAEANPTTETSTVTVTIPVVFQLNKIGSSDATFGTLGEADIIAGDTFVHTAMAPGILQVRSNYNTTTLTAQATTNFAPGLVATLKGRQWNSDGSTNNSGLITIINNGVAAADQAVVSWGVSGANTNLTPCYYELTDVSVADDQGSYTAVVTYTLTGV